MHPNTFIIGAPKCGTSALSHYLSEHPNVFFSNPKEPFYWCSDFEGMAHEFKFQNINDYLKLFSKASAPDHKIIAEGSTRYLMSRVAIRKILDFNPSAKFIIMLRNPVEVIQAYHMENYYSLYENCLDFETAWKNQPNSTDPARSFTLYRKVASFGEQLRRAKALIPENQILIILLDDLKTDAQNTYNEVLTFLNLPRDNRAHFPIVNASHKHRFRFIAKAVLDPPKFVEKPILQVRHHLRVKRYKPIEKLKAFLNVEKERTHVSEAFRKELQEHFSQDISDLETLVNRDLSSWKHSDMSR